MLLRRSACCSAERGWLLETIEALVRARIAEHGQGRGRPLRRRAGARLDGARRGASTRLTAARARQPSAGASSAAAPSQILLLGHFDTVWPVGQLERMPLRGDDGRLYGPGVFDMKAGIAVAMLAMRALARTPRSPACRASSCCGRPTRKSAAARRAPRSRTRRARSAARSSCSSRRCPAARARPAARACGEFELTVHGVAAHAGLDPGKGASAIHELAHQIVAIDALQDLERGVSRQRRPGRPAASRTNVVAGRRARAPIDVRVPTMADAAAVEAGCGALRPAAGRARGSSSSAGGFDRPPLERTPAGRRVCTSWRAAVARDLGAGAGRRWRPAAGRTGISRPRSGFRLRRTGPARRRRARAARTRRASSDLPVARRVPGRGA